MQRNIDRTDMGLQIKSARTIQGLKQEDLARIVGVSQASVCRWERGHYAPHGNVRAAVATALDTTLDKLFSA